MQRAEAWPTSASSAAVRNRFHPVGPQNLLAMSILQTYLGPPDTNDNRWSFDQVTDALVKMHAEIDEAVTAAEHAKSTAAAKQLVDLTDIVSESSSSDDASTGLEASDRMVEDQSDASTRPLQERDSDKLDQLRMRAETAEAVCEQARHELEETRKNLQAIQESQDAGRNLVIEEHKIEIERVQKQLDKEALRSQRLSARCDQIQKRGVQAVKALLQILYGDAQPSEDSLDIVISIAIPEIRRRDFSLNVDFTGSTKFVDSYLDLQFPDAIKSQLILAFLAIHGKLKDNVQLHDRRFQLQWLDQVVMPEVYRSAAAHGGQASGRRTYIVPVLMQWIKDAGIDQGVGATRPLALYLLFDMVSHFPYKDDGQWQSILDAITKQSFRRCDVMCQVTILRFLTLAPPHYDSKVQAYIGSDLMNFVKTMNPRDNIPTLLRQLVARRSSPCVEFFESVVDDREVILVYTENDEFMFVKGQEGRWSCSIDGATLAYDHGAGQITTATFAGGVVLKWAWNSRSEIDAYMHLQPERKRTIQTTMVIAEARTWGRYP